MHGYQQQYLEWENVISDCFIGSTTQHENWDAEEFLGTGSGKCFPVGMSESVLCCGYAFPRQGFHKRNL